MTSRLDSGNDFEFDNATGFGHMAEGRPPGMVPISGFWIGRQVSCMYGYVSLPRVGR